MSEATRTTTKQPTLTRIGEGMYWAASRSKPGTFHYVDLADQTCECKGYDMRGRCAHLDVARPMEAEHVAARRTFERQQQAQPVALRPAGMASLAEAFGAVSKAESGWATSDYPF